MLIDAKHALTHTLLIYCEVNLQYTVLSVQNCHVDLLKRTEQNVSNLLLERGTI